MPPVLVDEGFRRRPFFGIVGTVMIFVIVRVAILRQVTIIA